MPVVSIGDMSQHFLSLRNTGSIKSDMARLGQELSTGRVANLADHLNGDTRQFQGISHSLEVLDAYKKTANETAIELDHTQVSLNRLEGIRGQLTGSLLLVSADSSSVQIKQAAAAAKLSFGDMISTINATFAGKHVLSGSNVDKPPLARTDLMIDDIVSQIGSSTQISDIVAAVEAWFENPTGGFFALGYQGDLGPIQSRNLSNNHSVSSGIRADDAAIRGMLKGAALAAILPALQGNISLQDQGRILQQAGLNSLEAAEGSALLQSTVGSLQETVGTAITEISSESTSMSILYNDLSASDSFETATKLDAIQTQLETHFAVTGRLSRLSLLEYI